MQSSILRLGAVASIFLPFDLLTVFSGIFSATIGFSASHFQPPRANCFLAKFAKKYFFRRYSLLSAVKTALGEEVGLGSHGNVILMSRRSAQDPWVELHFVWCHNAARPFGAEVKLQCPQCFCLRPWLPPRLIKNPEAIAIVCRFCRHTTTYTKPVGLQRDGTMGNAGGGDWYITRRVLS